MNITEIEFTGTPVTDVMRARRFYEGVLGLEPSMESPDGLLVEYRLRNGIFTIACLGAAFRPSPDGTFIAFEVDDLDAALIRLDAHQVRFASRAGETPTARFAMIFDPDGNQIMIHKRKA